MQHEDNLIWIDCEMTGLDVMRDRLIEIAAIVTDSALHILAEGPTLVIHQSNEQLDAMDEWNTRQHTATGLVNAVRQSVISEDAAEQQMLAFLSQWVPKGVSPMCGNSICQDRRFISRYMPKLEQHFHYRHIDVSTIKELTRRWHPKVLERVQKKETHRALDDIKESIEELRVYQQAFFS